MKTILILIVKFYQKIAPQRIRQACRFEPSCSNYMILALKKYGVRKGLKMGVQRLRRCKYPHGGQDYP